jgi:hypothetical protein
VLRALRKNKTLRYGVPMLVSGAGGHGGEEAGDRAPGQERAGARGALWVAVLLLAPPLSVVARQRPRRERGFVSVPIS